MVQELGLEVSLLTKLRDELTAENSQILGSLNLTNKKLLDFESETVTAKNVLNEKISLLLAEKSGLLVDVEKGVQTIEQKEADRLRLTSRVISLSEQLRSLKTKLTTESEKNETLTQDVANKSLLLEGLQTSKADLQQKLDTMLADLQKLQLLYTNRGETVAALESQVSTASIRYKSLQEEYDSLEGQYRKLIRPARSTAGKVVVDVRYSLETGVEAYHLKTAEDVNQRRLLFAELHAQLAALKEQHGQKLYTKVIIDDDSGVSFNNAWKFTQSILSKYDYYAEDFADGQ
ncbi:MAG: chromosome segregation ATPase [Neolewinella sp.]